MSEKWKKILALKVLQPEHDPMLLRTLSEDELQDALLNEGLVALWVRHGIILKGKDTSSVCKDCQGV